MAFPTLESKVGEKYRALASKWDAVASAAAIDGDTKHKEEAEIKALIARRRAREVEHGIIFPE